MYSFVERESVMRFQDIIDLVRGKKKGRLNLGLGIKIQFKIWKKLNKKYNAFEAYQFYKSYKKKATTAKPQTSFHRLICVNGFGYSGSGALLDLLSEFKDTTVFSDVDPGYSLRNHNAKGVTNEFNLLRHVGGLFFLEKFFPSHNIFFHDFAAKLFLSLVKEQYVRGGDVFGDNFIKYTADFFNKIIYLQYSTSRGNEYSPHASYIGQEAFNLNNIFDFSSKKLYLLKPIEKEVFISYAKEYISNILNDIDSKKYLVLDQILGDSEADIEHYHKYFDNLKQIVVYRDPRDVFAFAISSDISWIPHDVNEFVLWYKFMVERYVHIKSDVLLVVKFEDLIFKKEEVVKKLIEFLGFDENAHIHPKMAFDENISRRNVGLYKSFLSKEQIDTIENELNVYLYKK